MSVNINIKPTKCMRERKHLLHLVGVNTAVKTDENRVARMQDIGKPAQEIGSVVTVEIADARAQSQDALLTVKNSRRLEPLAAIVIGAEQTEAADVLVMRQLGQRALELLKGQVEGVVLDALSGLFESLEKQVDLAEVATAELNDHGVLGDAVCNLGGGGREDVDFVVGQVVLLEVCDLD